MVFYDKLIKNPKLLLVNETLGWKNLTAKRTKPNALKNKEGLVQPMEEGTKNTTKESLDLERTTPTNAPKNKTKTIIPGLTNAITTKNVARAIPPTLVYRFSFIMLVLMD